MWSIPLMMLQKLTLNIWKQAMDYELQALTDNNTWSLVPLPPGKRLIGCKWVYRIKYKADNFVSPCC